LRQIVIISKKWDHPKISMVVTDEELSFAIDLYDFISAMKKEMEADSADIDKAVDNVIKGIKGEGVRVV